MRLLIWLHKYDLINILIACGTLILICYAFKKDKKSQHKFKLIRLSDMRSVYIDFAHKWSSWIKSGRDVNEMKDIIVFFK